jgi:hypothetical protein
MCLLKLLTDINFNNFIIHKQYGAVFIAACNKGDLVVDQILTKALKMVNGPYLPLVQ